MRKTYILFIAFLICPIVAISQPTNEEDVIKKSINQLFDGMRKGDSSMVSDVFYAGARLQTVSEKDGSVVLRNTPIDKFLLAVGTPHEKIFDERILSYDVKIDGSFASVWTEYEFYHGADFSHCGVNAFHLMKTPEGWKITQITDTRRKEDCGN